MHAIRPAFHSSCSEADKLLDAWVDGGYIRTLDRAFARFCLSLEPSAHHMAPLAALLSRTLADGHICLRLDDSAALSSLPGDPEACSVSPWQWWTKQGPRTWSSGLAESAIATTCPELRPAPLVLADEYIYLYRFWHFEMVVADRIHARLLNARQVDSRFTHDLDTLFEPSDANDWQKIACALAAIGRFTLVTGGPGTGKTTTVLRLLALLQLQAVRGHDEPLHLRLAAPTGKAAARLTESITHQIATLPVDEAIRNTIPARVTTVHRLLGSTPHSRRFRHDASNPLDLDVLVVDEASMIDLEMMYNLLQAVPAHAQVIFLGDKDQLASVEAGAVLGELCRDAAAGLYTPDTLEQLKTLCGQAIDTRGLTVAQPDSQPLAQRTVMLRQSRRFGTDSGIGQLAGAINRMDADGVRALLTAHNEDVDYVDQRGSFDQDLEALLRTGFADWLAELASRPAGSDINELAYQRWAASVLEAFDQFRVLCAVRDGPYGVHRLNQLAERVLAAALPQRPDQPWYEGRPVMVTRNDYGLGLMNGDIGVALRVPHPKEGDVLRVAFPDNDSPGALRFVLPSRLTAVETVYAMTVHKSQGSEFDRVALVLPDQSSPVLTKELLYTGVTRARNRVTLMAPTETVLWKAITQQVSRNSRLWALINTKNSGSGTCL